MKKLVFIWVLLVSLILSTFSSVAESGVTEDIPLGANISDAQTYTLDQELASDDISGLIDGTMLFQGSNYHVREVLEINQAGNPVRVETSLTAQEDDYQTDVVLEVARDSIKYYYTFSEPIQVNTTTFSDPLELKFLGKTIKIVDIDDTTEGKFTAIVGTEYFLNTGESVIVDGKVVELVHVGSAGAVVVDVDGVQDTISASQTKTVNGIEIDNIETFYDSNNQAASSAKLIMGKDAIETYQDGYAYVGEDINDPNWVWNVGNIKGSSSSTTTSTTSEFSGPYFGIENDFIWNDDSDNPAKVGECINLPNNYMSICLDSLTVSDDNYATYIFVYQQSTDLSDAISSLTAAKTIHIHTAQPNGLVVDQADLSWINTTIPQDIKTSEIWLYVDSGSNVNVFYRDNMDNKVKLAGSVSTSGGVPYFAHINYDNTKDTDVRLKISNETGTEYKLELVPYHSTNLPDYNDKISMFWSTSNGNFNSLGNSLSLEESNELTWTGTNSAPTTPVNIGTKNEDHRSRYGIITRNPQIHGASDEVVMDIPGDQVQANVVIKTNPQEILTEEIRYDITLNEGWNLISIPLILEDNSIETVMTDIKNHVNVIYSYNPLITNKWEVWRPNSETANTLLTVEPGKAYWTKMNNPDVLNVNGTIDIKNGDTPGIIPTFNVYSGWNLVGYYGTTDETASTALQNIDGKYSAVWTLFKDNLQSLQGVLKGLNFGEKLKLTHGYWIFLKENGVIVPTT